MSTAFTYEDAHDRRDSLRGDSRLYQTRQATQALSSRASCDDHGQSVRAAVAYAPYAHRIGHDCISIKEITHQALYPISAVARMLIESDSAAHAFTKNPSWRSICGSRHGYTHRCTPESAFTPNADDRTSC